MEKFYCKNCGMAFTSVRNLTMNSCPRHPLGPGRGKHELYEGSEKSEYTCKYCGHKFNNIRNMTMNSCPRHPLGPGKGKHSPAL